jgi:hypothetical protein
MDQDGAKPAQEVASSNVMVMYRTTYLKQKDQGELEVIYSDPLEILPINQEAYFIKSLSYKPFYKKKRRKNKEEILLHLL